MTRKRDTKEEEDDTSVISEREKEPNEIEKKKILFPRNSDIKPQILKERYSL